MVVYRKKRCLIRLFVLALCELCIPACIAQINITVAQTSTGTNFNVFVDDEYLTTTNTGPLVSVTDGTNNIPFTVIFDDPGVREIDLISITEPACVLTNSVTLAWTNYSLNVPIVTRPVFVTEPQSESVFVGSTAILPAQAVHTSGYQWQLNGTNLVESSHCIGVTNSTLTISNVQMSDAGIYTVIASNPLNPAATNATLSVYKPILLGLGATPLNGGFNLTIANEDGSPFEASRVPNLQIYSTANLTSDNSTWNLETNTGAISNGVLQVPFQNDGSAYKYWRVFEQ